MLVSLLCAADRRYNIYMKYHNDADDLQLFCHLDLHANSLSTAVHRVEQSIDEIKDWMTYYLCLIDSKTEILPICIW